MKNEKESKEKIQKSSSSTSEILESIDLTLRATTSTEPNILNLNAAETDNASEITTEIATVTKLSKRLQVVADVVNRLLDATVYDIPTTSAAQHFLDTSNEERSVHLVTSSQPNLRSPKNDLKFFRTAGGGIINSTSAMHSENCVKKANSKISLKRVPPSYSTVLKLGAPSAPQSYFDSGTYSSLPFIARQPPPSYAEVHGGDWDGNHSIESAESVTLGPNSMYIHCPRCRTIEISDTHSERSHLTYIASLALCICLCWPCCLIPFFVRACRNTYHFCPICHYYLGVYRPC